LAELFTTLRESPDFENWLIVIWSDHGEGLFSHQTFLHDELYDHTIHVPLIVRLPGGRYAGKRVAAPISAIDLAPTILELADCPAPLPMDGRSRLDLLTHDDGQGIAFSRRIKNGQRLFSVRDRRFHYIRDDRAGQEYFYDLASDPGEHHNLSPSGTAQEAALRRQLRAWVAEHDQAILHQGGDEAVIDDETAARLRALGYLR
jgi:choline-sulfatase